MNENNDLKKDGEVNPDPITGAPGSHPVGTGVGAAGAGLAATAIGAAVGGPIGAIVGAVVGSVAGGYAGKGVAEAVDPTAEEAYWRENHSTQTYDDDASGYDSYDAAYRTGYSNYTPGKSFDEAEPDLAASYDLVKGPSHVGWDKGRFASKAAWQRLEEGGSTVDLSR